MHGIYLPGRAKDAEEGRPESGKNCSSVAMQTGSGIIDGACFLSDDNPEMPVPEHFLGKACPDRATLGTGR